MPIEKTKIWQLVADGIKLRDEGIRLRDAAEWRDRCLAWEAAIVAAVGGVNQDLAHLLSPLGSLDPVDNSELVPHQKDVMAMSTIIRLLRQELPKIR